MADWPTIASLATAGGTLVLAVATFSSVAAGRRSTRIAEREGLHEASLAGEMLTVDLLYRDHEGGQRTISRFILTREDDDQWRCGVVRHWAFDGVDARVP